jgi:hypothetical protein
MSLVEILDVALTELDAEQLRGRNIEFPKTGSYLDSDTFHVVGWVLGRSSLAITVEILQDGTIVQSSPLDVQHPDIVAAFPDASGAEQSGFRTTVAVSDPGNNKLIVQALLQDESRVPLGVIQARRHRSGEESYGESSGQVQSRPLTRLLRRVLGRRGG